MACNIETFAATDETMVAALLREREGYVRHGMADRVAQVDEQLKHYGYEAERDAGPAAVARSPRGRNAEGGRQTAEGGSGRTAARRS
ncbi:hypothetical protein [Sphaerimonospora thailandensis]|uniref:Uncharacterized protein n=1 Tax=Sphaerimonospora thailandensis TaxID=795644 RepID=A0A8J3R6V3_9ACTN|nr:hypothetical protein [Sphaerimonospora thailandensis]GIH69445.1 hypothetical protein Mth01_16980 [Sphaerimonospora thailandensis]